VTVKWLFCVCGIVTIKFCHLFELLALQQFWLAVGKAIQHVKHALHSLKEALPVMMCKKSSGHIEAYSTIWNDAFPVL